MDLDDKSAVPGPPSPLVAPQSLQKAPDVPGRPRGREPSRPDDNDDGQGSSDASNSTVAAPGQKGRRRRRSRKDMERKFVCSYPGCGKPYSRAEHLSRHFLNHKPGLIYPCNVPGCPYTSVRQDLRARHEARHHTTRRSLLPRRDGRSRGNPPGSAVSEVGSSTQSVTTEGTLSPETPTITASTSPSTSFSPPSTSGSTASPVINGRRSPPKAKPQPTSPKKSDGWAVSSLQKKAPVLQSEQPVKVRRTSGDSATALRRASNAMNAPPIITARTNGNVSFNCAASSSLASTPGGSKPFPNPTTYGSTVTTPTSSMSGLSLQSPYSAPMSASSALYSPPINTSIGSMSLSMTSMGSSTDSIAHSSFGSFSLPTAQFPAATSTPMDTTSIVPASTGYDLDSYVGSQNMQYHMPLFGEDGESRSPHQQSGPAIFNWIFDPTADPSATQLAPLVPVTPLGFATDFNDVALAPPTGLISIGTLIPPNPASTASSARLNLTLESERRVLLDIVRDFPEMSDYLRRHRATVQTIHEAPPLSLTMLQHYIDLYWGHFHRQLPILHKPTFSVEKVNPLQLLAIIVIGTACMHYELNPEMAQSAAELGNIIVTTLRGRVFDHADFAAPAQLWIFQTLLLIEYYEKMYATRFLHERAHIHHATTLTLMKRGHTLVGRPGDLDSPSSRGGGAPSHASASSSVTFSEEQRGIGTGSRKDEMWNRWIIQETGRRVSFAAFVLDTLHATMFGHSAILNAALDINLELPCDENIWGATTASDCFRFQSSLAQSGVKPPQFRAGLFDIVHARSVQTNSFGRTILMAGLLNVQWHSTVGEKQSRVTRGEIGIGGGDQEISWKIQLTRSFDHWLTDFDRYLNNMKTISTNGILGVEVPSTDDVQHENIFESRTVLFHLAHISRHADIVDIQIFAGARNVLGRSIGPQRVKEITMYITKQWAPRAIGRDAAYFAIQFLSTVMLPQERTNILDAPLDSPPTTGLSIYSARDDHLLNRPWVLYYACLVVWCYGFALDGPLPRPVRIPTSKKEKYQDMYTFLKHMKEGPALELDKKKGKNQCLGLLLCLKELFAECRWRLLKEAAERLDVCAKKLIGEEP